MKTKQIKVKKNLSHKKEKMSKTKRNLEGDEVNDRIFINFLSPFKAVANRYGISIRVKKNTGKSQIEGKSEDSVQTLLTATRQQLSRVKDNNYKRGKWQSAKWSKEFRRHFVHLFVYELRLEQLKTRKKNENFA